LNIWFENLPFKYDKNEGIVNHELFVRILVEKPQMIWGDDMSKLAKVIKIFGTILDTK